MRSQFHPLPIVKTHFLNIQISNYLTLKHTPGISILILFFTFFLSIRHILRVFTIILNAPPTFLSQLIVQYVTALNDLLSLYFTALTSNIHLASRLRMSTRIPLLSLCHCIMCYKETINFTMSLNSHGTSECINFCNNFKKFKTFLLRSTGKIERDEQ